MSVFLRKEEEGILIGKVSITEGEYYVNKT